MLHTESTVKIYHTKEYSRFNMINGNRQIVALTVKKIMRDIAHGLDVLRYCPIIVEEKKGRLDIIDGQHRFYVARKMKSTIWYVLAEKFEIQDIAKINSNTQNWKPKDFIHSFIQQGNKEYEVLQKFVDEYNLPLSISIKLLQTGLGNVNKGLDENPREQFQKGKFQAKELKTATLLAKYLYQFVEFPGYKNSLFIAAISKIMMAQVCDMVDLVAKFKKDPSKLEKQDSAKAYLTSLENIYNIGNHKRRVIF